MNSINGARATSALLAVIVLAGCTVAPPPAPEPEKLEPEVVVKTRVVDRSCLWFKPAYPGPTDILSDSFAKQTVDNNEAGALHCGWKPPVK
jgi:hypothetical protein